MFKHGVIVAVVSAIVFKIAAAATYPITGITAGVNTKTFQRPFRTNFNTFQNAGPAFDLYIQALQMFQATGQAAELSYYQVAGIHGYPDVEWDGAAGADYSVGYCTHASILFPTWHRPYMALYEVCLTYHAIFGHTKLMNP
jgi:tyrosinase